MKKGKNILVIGRHAEMMDKVISLLQQEGYDAEGYQTNETAIAAFRNGHFHAVVIGGGVDHQSRDLFHQEFNAINPVVKIIDAHPSTILRSLSDL